MSDLDVVGVAPDPVHALAYLSTPTVPFSDRDLSDLLLSARSYNAAHGITGKLLVLEDDDGAVVRFAQWIEGSRSNLAACLARIRADERHTPEQIREHGEVPGRRFPGWDMAFEAYDPAQFTTEAETLTA